jgi:predicted aspartyl protease
MSFAFDPNNGPVHVRAEISGPLGSANLRLVLDTGATMSLIRSAVLIGLGYEPDASNDRMRVAMGNGLEVVPRVTLTRLSALGMHRIGMAVLAHSLPAEAGVDGLLGLDFLRGQILTLDFVSGQVTLG